MNKTLGWFIVMFAIVFVGACYAREIVITGDTVKVYQNCNSSQPDETITEIISGEIYPILDQQTGEAVGLRYKILLTNSQEAWISNINGYLITAKQAKAIKKANAIKKAKEEKALADAIAADNIKVEQLKSRLSKITNYYSYEDVVSYLGEPRKDNIQQMLEIGGNGYATWRLGGHIVQISFKDRYCHFIQLDNKPFRVFSSY